MKMKCLFFLLAFPAALFASCGSGSSSESEEEVNLSNPVVSTGEE